MFYDCYTCQCLANQARRAREIGDHAWAAELEARLEAHRKEHEGKEAKGG